MCQQCLPSTTESLQRRYPHLPHGGLRSHDLFHANWVCHVVCWIRSSQERAKYHAQESLGCLRSCHRLVPPWYVSLRRFAPTCSGLTIRLTQPLRSPGFAFAFGGDESEEAFSRKTFLGTEDFASIGSNPSFWFFQVRSCHDTNESTYWYTHRFRD